MGDETQIPSLTTNLLYVYQMTYTSSPNRVVFGLDSVEISYISIGKLIAKGVANHASKAYELSQFFPYSDLVHSQQPFEREGKFILPKTFAYDNIFINVSDLESEAEDQVELVYGIEDQVQSDPDPDPVPTLNPRPKWTQNVIDDDGNMTGDSYDKRRTISWFQ